MEPVFRVYSVNPAELPNTMIAIASAVGLLRGSVFLLFGGPSMASFLCDLFFGG